MPEHLSLSLQPIHGHLDVGLAARLVFLEAQSTAGQLCHAEKCVGVVRWW